MKNKLIGARRILIIGDSGRGKSTFAPKLSQKLNLPVYSTDDFFWKIKFSEPNDRQESIKKIEKIYLTDDWVVEGGTIHLIRSGLDRADVIINLIFRNIIQQWWSLIKRNRDRKYENLMRHLTYVTCKRFGIGNTKEKAKRELLKPYSDKILTLKSYKEMNDLLGDL